jgi:hypothetical protein
VCGCVCVGVLHPQVKVELKKGFSVIKFVTTRKDQDVSIGFRSSTTAGRVLLRLIVNIVVSCLRF